MDFFSVVAERTRSIPLGTGVTAPIFRYNPALVAQAFATLGNLYPGRIFLGVGAGEAMNEVPIGYRWPGARERIDRLEEALGIIKDLWSGGYVTRRGKYYTMENAHLYTLPSETVPIYVAAHGPVSARVAGRYGNGLVIIDKEFPATTQLTSTLANVRKAAAESGKDPESLYNTVLLTCAYGKDLEAVVKACKKWAVTAIPSFHKRVGLHDPKEIEKLGEQVDFKELTKTWLVSNDPDEYIKRIDHYAKLGFGGVQLCNLGPDEEDFIKMQGENVIPYAKDV